MTDLFEQSLQRFTAMPRTSRWMAGALLLLVVVSSYWILSTYDSQAKVQILGTMSPGEIQLVCSSLDAAGLTEYELSSDGARVKVPLGKRSDYIKTLKEAEALPATWQQLQADAQSSGFFESSAAQSQREERIKERTLEQTLRIRPKVDHAWVEFSQAEGSGFEPDRCACVIQVQRVGNKPIDHTELKNIGLTAAKYFAGLTHEDVFVVDLSTSRTNHDDIGSESPMALLEAKTQWEQYYQAKVAELLYQYGNLKVFVEVNIDPSFGTQQESTTLQAAEQPAELVTMQRPVESARPKLGMRIASDQSESNGLVETGADGAMQVVRKERHNFGQQHRTEKTAGMSPRSVHISVGLPESYYREQLLQQQKLQQLDVEKITYSDEEVSKIRAREEESVRSALQVLARQPEGISVTEQASVSVYSYQDLPPPEQLGQTASQLALAWAQENANTLWLSAAAVICFVLLHYWTKAARRSLEPALQEPRVPGRSNAWNEDPRALPPNDGLETNSAGELETPLAARESSTHRDASGVPDESDLASDPELKKAISQLVKADPDATKSALERWLQDAA